MSLYVGGKLAIAPVIRGSVNTKALVEAAGFAPRLPERGRFGVRKKELERALNEVIELLVKSGVALEVSDEVQA